jgi:hypothetical protein
VPGREPQSSTAKVRLAVAPLRRLAVSVALRSWLPDTLRTLAKHDSAYNELSVLLRSLDALQTKNRARHQVAEFYRDWLVRLESVSANSRALTLYQDFSSAFALGSRAKPFDRDLEDVPNPAVIAKQLMVNCL